VYSNNQDTLKQAQNQLKTLKKKMFKAAKVDGFSKKDVKLMFAYDKVELFQFHLNLLDKNYDEIQSDFISDFNKLKTLHNTLVSEDPPIIPFLPEEMAHQIYEHHKYYDNAARMLKAALTSRKNSGIIYLNLARMYYKSKDKINARKYLTLFNKAWKDADKNLIQFEQARVLQLDLEK